MSTIRANAIVDAGGGNAVTVNGALAVNETSLGTFAAGESGRPRLFGAALARPSDGLYVLTTAAADTYFISVGTTVVVGAYTNTATTNVVAETITVNLYTGALRFKASHQASGGFTSTLEVYKNNTLVTAFTTNLSTAVARAADISVVPGDVIEWRHRISAGGAVSTVSSVFENASEAWVEQPAYRRATMP